MLNADWLELKRRACASIPYNVAITGIAASEKFALNNQIFFGDKELAYSF